MILYGQGDSYATDRYGGTDPLDPYREQLYGGHTSYMEQLLDGHDSYISYVLDGHTENSDGYSTDTGQAEPYTGAGAENYGGLTIIPVFYRDMYDPDYW